MHALNEKHQTPDIVYISNHPVNRFKFTTTRATVRKMNENHTSKAVGINVECKLAQKKVILCSLSEFGGFHFASHGKRIHIKMS